MAVPKATFGLDENVASAATYVLWWLTGIIFLLVEKDNKTVRFHAMQSILTFLSISILIWVLTFVFAFSYAFFTVWWVISLIELLAFILWLFLMYKAYKGEKFKVPIIGDIAENQTK